MGRPRIVGGSAKGRELETPKSGTRPSPSRLREALFDIVAFEPKGPFADLYSGSGAIGLEAASRGWPVTCVELSRPAAGVISRNAARLGLHVDVVTSDALAFAKRHRGVFQVVAAAPPYPDDLPLIFAELLSSGAARPGGLYVLQHPTGLPAMDPAALPSLAGATVRTKRYGTNSVTLVRVPS